MEIRNELGLTVPPDVSPHGLRSTSPPADPAFFSTSRLVNRRLANDPDMMYELHRYRRLMLLTLLPNIAPETTETTSPLHPHAHLHSEGVTPTPPIEDTQGNRRSFVSYPQLEKPSSFLRESSNEFGVRFLPPANVEINGNEFVFPEVVEPQEEKEEEKEEEVMHNFSYITTNGADTDQLSRSIGCIGSGGAAATASRIQIKSANSETRLPVPGKGLAQLEQANSKADHKRMSTSRRYSLKPAGADPNGPSNGNSYAEADTSELDLLTLAELYLESRHRVFGDEWNQRQNLQSRSGPPSTGHKVGGTGIHQRPHRLSPLAKDVIQAPVLPKTISTKGKGAPAPSGLHLSVNYTNNLDIEATMLLMDRAKALKPRIRRLNSLDDLITGAGEKTSSFEGEDTGLYRPNSAPDLAKKQQEKSRRTELDERESPRLLFNDRDEGMEPGDLSSPPGITPARANTPTSAPSSSDMNRPPLMGASLATSLSRITSSRSRPETRDCSRNTTKTPDSNSPSRIRNLHPENPLRTSSLKKRNNPLHITDLDVLRELGASLHNQVSRQTKGMQVQSKSVLGTGSSFGPAASSTLNKMPIAPIGSSILDLKAESKGLSQTDPRIERPLVKGKSRPKIMDSVGNHRPLHQSLPARLSTPQAPPPTALSEAGRRNSRIVLTPLDANRKNLNDADHLPDRVDGQTDNATSRSHQKNILGGV